MDKHLTTAEKVKTSVRPISSHLDESRINIYIEEAELLNIKPHIGDELYLQLLEYTHATNKTLYPAQFETLLNGGKYTCTLLGKNTTFYFKGLLTALHYYVYAKLIKHNHKTVTRFGYVEKDDSHSTNTDLKERLASEKDSLTIADTYLDECIQYLHLHNSAFGNFLPTKQPKNRIGIKIIGD